MSEKFSALIFLQICTVKFYNIKLGRKLILEKIDKK